MSLENIYAPIKQDLEKVEERLKNIVVSDIYPVQELYNYVLLSGGKRIRPALVLLSAKSLDFHVSEVIDVACAIELIHAASLIHDDIIDVAELRRSKPSAHVVLGAKATVIVGDYLFSRAIEILAKYENHEVIKVFSKAVKSMSEGELLQTANYRNITLTEEEYISIVSGKTAALMSASCEIVTKLASTSELYSEALAQYGLNIGILYQMMDDVLDLVSTEERLGKPVRNNIREGNITLPIIYTLENTNGDFKQQLISILSNEEIKDTEIWSLIDSISNSGAFAYSESIARKYANRAKEALNIIKDSTAKRCLLYFVDSIMNKYLTSLHV
jgi:octaprenyl-diphosphate synthase